MMKKLNLFIYIAFAVFVSTFIIGSFFDYQINEALFHKLDTFGLTISVIGTIPGYGVMAFLGGGAFYLAFNDKVPTKAGRIIAYIFAGILVGLAIFFSGRELFGPNGFYFIGVPKFVGYFIVLPVHVAIAFLGFKITSTSEYDKLWLVYLVLAVAILICLVAGVTLLKSIFHRPRFRTIVEVAGVDFHNWWDACTNYKDLMTNFGLESEEFKSFPSGHAGTAAVFMMASVFLPLINKKYERTSLICFCVGFAWLLLVAFSRMYLGAHFLSDVSMGSLLTIITFFVAKLVVENLKYFGLKNVDIEEGTI